MVVGVRVTGDMSRPPHRRQSDAQVIQYGAAAQERFPPRPIGGHQPIGVDEQLESTAVRDPAPWLTVVYGRGTARQSNRVLGISIPGSVGVISERSPGHRAGERVLGPQRRHR